MSQVIFQQHLRAQIEDSPFSEEFEIVPLTVGGTVITVKGIFDESVETDEKTRSTAPRPRIILFEKPVYNPGVSKISIRGKQYVMNRPTIDANIGVVIMLS